MKLNDQILTSLRGYATKIANDVVIEHYGGNHAKKDELLRFLNDVASVSGKISVISKSSTTNFDPLLFEVKKK